MKKPVFHPEYQAVFQEEIDGGFSVWVPDLPGCASQGETLEEALENIKEAIELYLEDSKVENDTSDYQYKRQFVVPVTVSHACWMSETVSRSSHSTIRWFVRGLSVPKNLPW